LTGVLDVVEGETELRAALGREGDAEPFCDRGEARKVEADQRIGIRAREGVTHKIDYAMEMRGVTAVVLELGQQPAFSLAARNQSDRRQCRPVRHFLHRDTEILPATRRVQDSVAVHPTAPVVLHDIERNPLVDPRHELEVADVGKGVGLHDAEFHAFRIPSGALAVGG
jgi:hypothetical protein